MSANRVDSCRRTKKPDDPYEAALVAGPKFCVACGQEVELTQDGYANHHCDPRTDAAKKAANTRAHDGFDWNPPLWRRLDEGFSMLEEDAKDGR